MRFVIVKQGQNDTQPSRNRLLPSLSIENDREVVCRSRFFVCGVQARQKCHVFRTYAVVLLQRESADVLHVSATVKSLNWRTYLNESALVCSETR